MAAITFTTTPLEACAPAEPMEQHSEKQILAALTRREAWALEKIMERHGDFLYRVASRMGPRGCEPADLVQEALLRLWSKPPRWIGAGSDGAGKNGRGGKLETWLYRLIRNIASESSKDEARRAKSETDFGEVADANPTMAEMTERESALERLEGLIIHLSPRQRETVILRLLEGRSVAEAARLMGCREGTVKAQLNRATKRLRELYSRTEPDQEVTL